jgi:hypothetical protein
VPVEEPSTASAPDSCTAANHAKLASASNTCSELK